MELSGFGSFSSAHPEAYYPGEEAEGAQELQATADALLVVQGFRLRVHSQVLSVQSRVLRSLFAARVDGGGEGSGEDQRPSPKRARQGGPDSQDAPAQAAAAAAQAPVELEQALEGFGLLEVALFLRLAYHPEDASPQKLCTQLDSLAGAARLAHQLDAPVALRLLTAAMMIKVESLKSHSILLSWLGTAEHCQLAVLHASCIRRLASLLISGRNSDQDSGGPPPKRTSMERALDDIRQLQAHQDVSQKSVQAVLATLLSGARQLTAKGLQDLTSAPHYMPSVASVQQALEGGNGEQQGGEVAALSEQTFDGSIPAPMRHMVPMRRRRR